MISADAIFMMGPQGSGKGTQAKILAEKTGFFYWENGAVLRSMKGYLLKASGKTVGSIIDQGFLLTDEELLEILITELEKFPQDKGIIFDGVPRRIGQAQFLIDWLKTHGKNNLLTIFLSLPEDESLKRLLLRAQVEKRVDDTPDKIALRLKQFEEATLPILDYMREHTRFIEIDGQPPIPEVTNEIFRALELE